LNINKEKTKGKNLIVESAAAIENQRFSTPAWKTLPSLPHLPQSYNLKNLKIWGEEKLDKTTDYKI
jgi:hypothetical protein